ELVLASLLASRAIRRRTVCAPLTLSNGSALARCTETYRLTPRRGTGREGRTGLSRRIAPDLPRSRHIPYGRLATTCYHQISNCYGSTFFLRYLKHPHVQYIVVLVGGAEGDNEGWRHGEERGTSRTAGGRSTFVPTLRGPNSLSSPGANSRLASPGGWRLR